MRDLLETLLEENFAVIQRAKAGVLRHYSFSQSQDMIKVAIGMRRAGKTYFIYQTINQLLDQGAFPEQILFLNFEDDRLLPINAKTTGQLLDAFYALYPENHHRRCYLFLDEIHLVEDWQRVVRRYFDSKNVELFLTGSSAKLLSKEIHTSLRGRSLATEIWPYSFSEYLEAHKIKRPKKPFGQSAFDTLYKHLQNYLATGGFPAVQFMPKNEWRETLQGYIETTIMRDIIERYHVTNIALLKYLVTTLLKNAATTFSIHKFFNDVKSQGYKLGKETVHNYLKYIEDAFLSFMIPFYSESERTTQNLPKKIYAADPGLIQAVSTSMNELQGKLFENLIYLDLRRQNKKIYFYRTRDDLEIDFITIDVNGHRECIQACWDTSDPETLAREERALVSAKKELDISGKIITPRNYLRDFIQE